METILKIEEIFESDYDGFKITTTEQEIKLLISNGQSCCENWGYFFTEDNFQEFENSTLLSVSITDELLNTKLLEEVDSDYTSTMFVNVETSNGLLQFVAYNSHNGYYGHEAIVKSTQLTYSDYL